MTLIIDTREKLPYDFLGEAGIQEDVLRRSLPAGDYSIEGLETRVVVERKSLADFVNTVIHNRKRFYKELAKLSQYEHACVVVEANYQDIILGDYFSKASPASVIGSTLAIMIDFKVPVYFLGSRDFALRFTHAFLKRAERKVPTEKRCGFVRRMLGVMDADSLVKAISKETGVIYERKEN